MNISFRKVSSQEACHKLIKFLKEDVESNGGSAGEIVNMHGSLVQITVCKVPWGTLVINKKVSRLEALSWILEDSD